MLNSISFAFGTLQRSKRIHILAYTLYHPFRPVCTTRNLRSTMLARATVKDVNCARCLKTDTYKQLLEEHTKSTYLEQRLAELGSKRVSLFPEDEPVQKPMPGLRLVLDAEKEVRCAFYTVAVRMDAIKSKYKGGLRAFVEKYAPRCNRKLAVLCAMHSDDLSDVILDLEARGLKGKDDFACFDAASIALGKEMAQKMGSGEGSEVKFPLLWLKGHVQNGGVMVYPTDYS